LLFHDDVIGRRVRRLMTLHDEIRIHLEKQLDSLVRRSEKVEADLRQIHDRDWTERATELENDEVLEGLDEIALKEIEQIRAALARIESGTYGTCAACGQGINAERLIAVPSASTCLACTR
jgi:RNA polymerase-binding transcription factor DksA